MLNQQDKKEMLRDSASTKRKIAFRKGELLLNLIPSRCLDDYIGFLMDIQTIFSPFVPSQKKTITKFNKL
jgi:hypothetical protein